MQWYYADNGKSVGPCTDEAFQAAVVAGQITAKTLVWNAGMTSWEPYGKVAGQQQEGSAAIPEAGDGNGKCVECGNTFSTADMVAYEGSLVCAACKPVFFQRIQEGASALGNTPNREIMSEALGSLKGNWGMAIGVMCVSFIIEFVVRLIPFGLGSIGSLLIAGPMALGATVFYLAIIRASGAEFNMMFAGFKRFGTALGGLMLMGVLLVAWALPGIVLFIGGGVAMAMKNEVIGVICIILGVFGLIPAMVAAYAYRQMFYIIADNEDVGVYDAIKHSAKIMRGRKWKMFCLHLRFMGLGVIMGCDERPRDSFLSVL